LGQAGSEVFDVVGTSRSVHNFVEVRFFLEQKLLVAGDAFGEFVRSFVGAVKGQDGQGVYTGDGGRHGFCLRAQQVDVSIVCGQVPGRGVGVQLDTGNCFGGSGRQVGVHDLSPQQAGSSELGDFHEVVGAHPEVEFDLGGYDFRCQTSFYTQLQEDITIGQPVTQFLGAVGAGVSEVVRIGSQYPDVGQGGTGFHDGFNGRSQVDVGVETLYQKGFERVKIDGAGYGGRVDAVALDVIDQQLSQCSSLLEAGPEV